MMNGQSPLNKRPRSNDSAVGTRGITTSDNSTEGATAGHVAFQCRVVAGLLGAGPFDKSSLKDQAWITKLHGLVARGISASAVTKYFETVTTGIVPDPISDSVSDGASEGSQLGFPVYKLPESLRRAQTGSQGYTVEFVKFAKGFSEADFCIRSIMEDARHVLMANREQYFAENFCEVVVDVPDFGKVRASVRDAYALISPALRGGQGIVISTGNNLKEWVVQVGKGIGTARTKKEARMIAVIRDQNPDFIA